MTFTEKQKLAELLLLVARNPSALSAALTQLLDTFSDLPNTITDNIKVDPAGLVAIVQPQMVGASILNAGLFFVPFVPSVGILQADFNTGEVYGMGVNNGTPGFVGKDLTAFSNGVIPANGLGIVLTSPNGTQYKISVDNAGIVVSNPFP